MTTYATRSPLQPLHNPHIMSELRRSSRRISANLAQKEDAPTANGARHDTERGKNGQKHASDGKSGKTVNIGSSKTVGGPGKRKFDYDEEDDGFAFSRTRSKRAKAEAQKRPEPITEDAQEEKAEPVPVKKPQKKSVEVQRPVLAENAPKEKRRRSPRNSADHQATPDPPPIHVKKKRVENKISNQSMDEAIQHGPVITQQDQEPPKATERREISCDITKIALPFADTPIIRRNKEMRDNRRSSLGMRGRRASSLIDSGKSNALPHDDVDSSEFYKHIESGLPEPRRMRQLLTWCGTRALGEKPASTAHDYHAGFAAREIQQQLLKDFSTKSEMSDWFNRRESTPPPRAPRANPKNTSNLVKIDELEEQIARLRIERQTWESILQPPTAPLLPPPSPTLVPIAISPDILDSPSQTEILATILPNPSNPSTSSKPSNPPNPSNASNPSNPSTSSTSSNDSSATNTANSKASKPHEALVNFTNSRLQKATQNLEFEIDKFADNVHVLGSHIDSASRAADEVLKLSAAALEERDRVGRERAGGGAVGVRDVLRGLSRVID